MLILHQFESSTSQEITGQEVCVYGEGWKEGEPAILSHTLGGAVFTHEALLAGWDRKIANKQCALSVAVLQVTEWFRGIDNQVEE